MVPGMPEVTMAVKCRVSGTVQGVGFRFSVVDVARRLGLTGWVRNTPDGRVEVLAQGPPDAVRDLVDYLGVGPRSARVVAVTVEEMGVDPTRSRFEIR